jgi:F-type H+-transporting ATPase subunit epsilon
LSTFSLTILTPRKKFFSGKVSLLNVVTIDGEIGVMANHHPLVAVIKTGPMHIIIDDKKQYYATSGGILSVKRDEVSLLLETIEKPEDIDIERAKKAKERAESALGEHRGEVEILRAQAALLRALTRIDVYDKYRN